MGLVTPLVTYNSITIGGTSVALSSTGRASFNSPYNRINVVMTPTNCSLSYYEVRITAADAAWDIETGTLAYWDTNIAANTAYSYSINVNSTNFNLGDGSYRVSLYAKSSIDGSWDVTYIFFTVDNEKLVPSGASALEVLTTRDAPSNS